MKLKEFFTEARLYFGKLNAEICIAAGAVGLLGSAILASGRFRMIKQPKITNNYLKRHHKPMKRRWAK